ncbi:MAG: exopolyphosphatase [Cytophagales bacterium]
MRIAVVDLGTNTFHLLIADLSNGHFEIIYREKTAVKIGKNGISKGLISDEAQFRALQTLEHFQTLINSYNVSKTRSIATSAFRNAVNGFEFANTIKDKIGFEIEIISGDDEASFIYEGVNLATNLCQKKALVVDIGGGSVEFIIGINGKKVWQRSYEIGGQRLMDMFHQKDPIPNANIDLLKSYLNTKLASLFDAINDFNPEYLVGSSGSFDTLAEIYQRETRPDFDIEKEKTTLLPVEVFYSIHQSILKKNKEERLKIPGMIELRADMIVVASILIETLLRRLPQNPILVSTFALKEGVLKQELDILAFDFQNNSD